MLVAVSTTTHSRSVWIKSIEKTSDSILSVIAFELIKIKNLNTFAELCSLIGKVA